MDIITRDAIEQSYADVHKLIHQMAYSFNKRCPHVPFEEILSIACEGYVDAYATYKPSADTQFITWVYWKIKYRLMECARKVGKAKEATASNPELFSFLQAKERFDFRRFMQEISDEARTVVSLVFDSPKELSELFGIKPTKVQTVKDVYKLMIRLGWTCRKVRKVVKEIREALR